MCAHVASSEGCVFSVSARSVCAHVVGCCGLPVYLDFAVRVSACLWLKEVCARVLPVWRVCASYRVCSGGLGSVLVFPRDWVCILWWVRARGAVHSIQPLLFVVSEGVHVCWGVCVWPAWGHSEVSYWGVSLLCGSRRTPRL